MAESAWSLPRKRARTVSSCDPDPHSGVDKLLNGFVAFALLERREFEKSRPWHKISQSSSCSTRSPGVRGACALVTAAAPHDTARLLLALTQPHAPLRPLNNRRVAVARKKSFATQDEERLLYWTSFGDPPLPGAMHKSGAAQVNARSLDDYDFRDDYSGDDDSEGELSAWAASNGPSVGDPHVYSHLYSLPPRSRRAALLALFAAVAESVESGKAEGEGSNEGGHQGVVDVDTAASKTAQPSVDAGEAIAHSRVGVPVIKLPLRELTELLAAAVRDELACRRQHQRLWEVKRQQQQQQPHCQQPCVLRDTLHPSPALHEPVQEPWLGSYRNSLENCAGVAVSDAVLPFPEYPDCSKSNDSDNEVSKLSNDHTSSAHKFTANGVDSIVDQWCAPLLLGLIDYALQGWRQEFDRLTDCVLDLDWSTVETERRMYSELADPGAVELEMAALSSSRAALVASLVDAAEANRHYKAWLLAQEAEASSRAGKSTEVQAPPPHLAQDSFKAEAVADQLFKGTNLRLPRALIRSENNARGPASVVKGSLDPRTSNPAVYTGTGVAGSGAGEAAAGGATATSNVVARIDTFAMDSSTKTNSVSDGTMPAAPEAALTAATYAQSEDLPGSAATVTASTASTSPRSLSEVLPTELCEKISALAPKLAGLDALGATALASPQAQALIKATCTVLKGAAAVDSTRLNSANSGGLEVLGRVCGSANNNNNNKSCETGDDVPSLALAQRSDALVGALCTAFVGPSLGSAACSVFLRTVILPMCLALKKPASRLLVAAVCHAAQERPDLTVAHVLLPMLCRPAQLVNSAHCELSTRLIKSGHLPPNTLNFLLQRLAHNPTISSTTDIRDSLFIGNNINSNHSSSSSSGNRSSSSSGDGEQCMWSDLTIPVLVAALSALADGGSSNSGSNSTAAATLNRGAGGGSYGNNSNKQSGSSNGQKSLLTASTASALVEKLEHVVESSAPIRASLKAASLAHAIATKHTSCVIAPPTVSVLHDHQDNEQQEHGNSSSSSSSAAAEACEGGLRRALGQMSSFMAKSAIAALDRAAATAAAVDSHM